MTRLHRLLALAFAAAALGAAAQEQAFTNRATELRDRPASDARVVAPLADGTAVKVLSRSSGWTQVQAPSGTGWVRVFHLRFPATVESSGASGGALGGLSSMLGFGRPRTQEAKIATIGIRGLSQEDLQNANPNPEAVRRMQSFRADKPTAERFAREAKLASTQVAYVDEGGSPLPQGGRK